MEFRRKHEELENLTDSQIFYIMELLEKEHYKPSIEQNEELQELREEVDNLERELEDAEYEYNRLDDENEKLKQEIEDLKTSNNP